MADEGVWVARGTRSAGAQARTIRRAAGTGRHVRVGEQADQIWVANDARCRRGAGVLGAVLASALAVHWRPRSRRVVGYPRLDAARSPQTLCPE